MSAKKSQRLTISGRNLQFLQNLAEQMDETDLTATLSYLLTDVRSLGYGIGNKPQPQSQTQRQSSPLGFDPITFEPAFTPIPENQNLIDPTIQRLIDAGLEMDF